jgi:hypothetical protein
MSEKWSGYLSLLAINTLWIAAVFDPVGKNLGLRYVALLLVLTVLIERLLRKTLQIPRRADGYTPLFLWFVLIIPAYGLIMYLIRGGGIEQRFIDTSYIGAAGLFGCSLVYFHGRSLSLGFAALRLALRMLAVAIITSLVFYELKLPIPIIGYLVENGAAFFGPTRAYGGRDFYYVYLIASPMLIYLVAQELWTFWDERKTSNLVWCVVAVVSLFLSGTRANMLIAVFILPFLFLYRRWQWASIPAAIMVGAVCLLALDFLGFHAIRHVFNLGEASNGIKLGFIKGYVQIFSDPVTLLFGQGFNAHVWSDIFGRMLPGGAYGSASKTELTYIEFVRVFGLLMSVAFVYLMVCFLTQLSTVDSRWRWMAPAVFVYFVVCALNPYLFSSNGMLPLGLCAVALQRHMEKSGRANMKTIHSREYV